jgi:GGDEF domain-containing protein
MTLSAAANVTMDRGDPIGRSRPLDAAAVSTLERLESSEALAQGCVTMIGLDAIAARLGGRWNFRRELVYEQAERTLRRRLGDQGYCQRISETEYVVVLPGLARTAGQALCVEAMRETLAHFLGAARPVDLAIHEVTRITADGVVGERLDIGQVEEAHLRELAREAKERAARASYEQRTPFVAADGRRVRVSCTLEPVFLLRASQRIGYRLARRVVHVATDVALTVAERRNLASADIERVDFATLSRGLDRLRSEAAADKAPTLILPVSFVTLTSQRARATLLDFFQQAQKSVRHGLICEVGDIDDVPPSALLAATTLVRPYCLLVTGHFAELPARKLGDLREGGLQGVSIERPQGEADDAGFIGWTRALIRKAGPSVRSVMAYRLSSPRQAAIAAALGVTHGSFGAE